METRVPILPGPKPNAINPPPNDASNKSSGPHGLREDFFLFSYYMTMGDDDPRGVANLVPRGMIGRIYVECHLTLLYTKYTSFRPCGFREEDF